MLTNTVLGLPSLVKKEKREKEERRVAVCYQLGRRRKMEGGRERGKKGGKDAGEREEEANTSGGKEGERPLPSCCYEQ